MSEGYIARNPAKSRPLSPNVKRLMRLSRMEPQNPAVQMAPRPITTRDLMYCHLQGKVFMEAAAMGLKMDEFAPRYMNSQLAGVIDVSFSRAAGIENDELSNMLKVPILLKSPETIVETLYWIDEIIRSAKDNENMSMAVVNAITDDTPRLPLALQEIREQQTAKVSYLEYAYWLGYIYRYECLMHEESSRMVYGAFSEKIMYRVYREIKKTDIMEGNLSDKACQICNHTATNCNYTAVPSESLCKHRILNILLGLSCLAFFSFRKYKKLCLKACITYGLTYVIRI